jgi:hypothetical protein
MPGLEIGLIRPFVPLDLLRGATLRGLPRLRHAAEELGVDATVELV